MAAAHSGGTEKANGYSHGRLNARRRPRHFDGRQIVCTGRRSTTSVSRASARPWRPVVASVADQFLVSGVREDSFARIRHGVPQARALTRVPHPKPVRHRPTDASDWSRRHRPQLDPPCSRPTRRAQGERHASIPRGRRRRGRWALVWGGTGGRRDWVPVCCGLWALGSGLMAMGRGPWAVGRHC